MTAIKIERLRDRGHMLAGSRYFFEQRHVLEVDCPVLTKHASIDPHIDLIQAKTSFGWRYLHSSPEYGMKRLLSLGIGDIYQLSHVFRDGELSDKHNPEFMMAEWYRIGLPFLAMIEETADFIRLFLGDLSLKIISYREAFKLYASIDYVHATTTDLLACLDTHHIIPYPEIEKEGKDALLNLILGTLIEPHLGKEELLALTGYPASQAALATTLQLADELTANRFEIYYQGLELANGYHELANAKEQERRLIEANIHRSQLGKEELPLDIGFLAALESGLPECCGVAVGFDRLMMLRHNETLSQVIPFFWDTA